MDEAVLTKFTPGGYLIYTIAWNLHTRCILPSQWANNLLFITAQTLMRTIGSTAASLHTLMQYKVIWQCTITSNSCTITK